MKIGVPTETKAQEKRVGVTPSNVGNLIHAGHQVVVQSGAGMGAGYSDDDYKQMGARIGSAEDAWDCDMVIKVKEPLPSEYQYLRDGLIVYTYLHLAADKELAEALIDSNATGVAYETMIGPRGGLPLLFPMSEIAGRMSVQVGAHFLEQPHQGKGLLLAGATGVKRGNVVIIGAGTVGFNAAKMAIGLGANVTILDINAQRLAEVESFFDGKIQTLMSNRHNIATAIKDADLAIGAVLIPGAAAPKLVSEEMVANMAPGSVIVDIPIDQGGIFETSTHATTHQDPIYISHGVSHYTVANVPGAVPKTATDALSSATIPYALEIANKGLIQAAEDDNTILTGINTYQEDVTEQAVAESLDMPYAKFDANLTV